MFEDSTFESAGRINKASKSKYWMMVTLITNGSILSAPDSDSSDLP